MTPLSEALEAAQKRALAAMTKAYVGEAHTEEQLYELMDAIGATDKVDQQRLIASLDVIRNLGAAVPAETNGAPKQDQPASEKQMQLIRDLMARKSIGAPHPRESNQGSGVRRN